MRYKNVLFVLKLQVDPASTQNVLKLSRFFVSAGVWDTLYRKAFSTTDTVFPFLVELIDKAVRHAVDSVTTKVDATFSDVLNNVLYESPTRGISSAFAFDTIHKLNILLHATKEITDALDDVNPFELRFQNLTLSGVHLERFEDIGYHAASSLQHISLFIDSYLKLRSEEN